MASYTQGKRGKVVSTDKVIRALRARAAVIEHDKKASVAVGYTTAYALFVHEDLTMNHPNGGQAKFLEQPARTQTREIGNIVKRELHKDLTRNVKGTLTRGVFSKALIKAGRYLEAESRKLVPVDTAFLISSSFTMLEERPT
jgi:hypothetical protein